MADEPETPAVEEAPARKGRWERRPLAASTIAARNRPNGAKWMARPNSMRAAFVREYLIDMSPTNAAIRAGYNPATAQDTARTLMKIPVVRDAVARAVAERSRRVGVTADRVLDHLGRMAFGNPKSVFNDDGTIKAPHELNDDDAMLVAGVKTRRIVEIDPDTGKMHQAEIQEVKLIDRTAVLALAMRHLGMNNDKLTVDVGGTLAEQLASAMARRDGGESELGEDGLSESDVAAVEDEERLLIDGVAEDDVLENDDGLTQEQRDLIG